MHEDKTEETMKNHFLVSGRPTVTAMLRSTTLEGLLSEIERVKEEGTDAFGFQIDLLRVEDRSPEAYRAIFGAMSAPCYTTNYARPNFDRFDDEELTRELLLALECGATLLDIRHDLYDRQPDELSYDPVAVERQKALIEEIHARGGEVLMSAHVLRYQTPEQVLAIAKEQKARGADIAKIVIDANNDEELAECFRASLLLKSELGIPCLFLCNGTHCIRHRRLAPAVAGDMFLVVEPNLRKENQPPIDLAKDVLRLSGYEI